MRNIKHLVNYRKSANGVSTTAAVVVIIIIIVAAVAGVYIYTTTTAPTTTTTTTSTSSSTSTTGSTSTSSSSSVTGSCTATGGTGAPYTIGVIEPTTGALGSLGKEIYDGADLAAAQWNATGGIPDSCGVKHPIKLVLEDGGPDTTNIALQSAQYLVNNIGAQVIIGPCCSADVSAIGSFLVQHHVVMVSSSATAGFITSNYTSTPRYIYRTVASDDLQTIALASIINQKGWHKIDAVVSNEPYGLGIANGLKDDYANSTTVTVKVVPYDTGSSAYASYPTVIQGVVADHPDAILYAGFVQDLVVFWKDASQAGLSNIPTLGVEGIKSSNFFPYGRGNAGPCAGGNCPTNDSTIASYLGNTSMVGTATHTEAGTPLYNAFASNYTKAYGISCAGGGCLFAPETYDAAELAFRAIKAAGSYNGTAIAQQMIPQSQGYSGPSGAKTFDKNGDVESPYDIWKVEYNSTTSSWTIVDVGLWDPVKGLNCTDPACQPGSSISVTASAALSNSLVLRSGAGSASFYVGRYLSSLATSTGRVT